jgi:hypothetical protein
MDDYVLDEVDVTHDDYVQDEVRCRAGRHLGLEEQEERVGSINVDPYK